MNERSYTHAELDEIFRDDPTWRESQRRLAAIEVRKLLDIDPRLTGRPFPIADATLEQVTQYNKARRLVRDILRSSGDKPAMITA